MNAALATYRRAQSRLAARVNAVHDEAHARADRLADRVAAVSAAIWREMWAAILGTHAYADRLRVAREQFERLTRAMEEQIGAGLRGLLRQAHAGQARGLVETLPREYLDAIAASRNIQLLEADSAGQVEIGAEGVRTAVTPEHWQDLLFPAPSEAKVNQIVMSPAGPDKIVWTDRLKRLSKLVDADQAATAIAIGLSQGKSTRELAKDLVPAVQGYRSSAMRIARTEGLRVAHVGQMECHDQLGDLNAGFTIRATIDIVTRPKHAARNGRQWFKDSGADMRTTLAMEQDSLPDSPNCRCRLVPLLRPPANIPAEAAEILKTAIVPEVRTAQDWWATATVAQKRASVGVARYAAASSTLGRPPQFADFIDPQTADLVTPSRIQAEGKAGILARRQAVKVVQKQQAAGIAETRRWGFTVKATPVPITAPILFPPPALLPAPAPVVQPPPALARPPAAPVITKAADLANIRPGSPIVIAGQEATLQSVRRFANTVVATIRTLDGRTVRYKLPASTPPRRGRRVG